MRTLTVFHTGGVGGPQRSVLGAMRWLEAQGAVEFVVPEPGPTADEYGALGPVSVFEYSPLTYARGIRERARLGARLVRETRMFRAELRRRAPDLVVVVTTVVPAALLAARLERIPSVVWAGELYDQPWKNAPFLRVWGALLARATALLADGIVCCSGAIARQFPARAPVVVGYAPVGHEYASGDRDAARARYGLHDASPCLAVVGSITRGRGQDVALRALEILRRRSPGARLLVVGSPHPRPVDRAFADELRQLARRLGVDDAVVFAGDCVERRAMADVYAAADIVVNPARFAEPFGRVVPEALVAGRPVVASRVGAIPEVVRDGVDGLLVPPDDPHALAAAAERLVREPELAERLVASGRRRVHAEFGHAQDLAAWRRCVEPAMRRAGHWALTEAQ
jgi:glycosyltransferase involved in cell wall biosynthesis